MRNNFRNFLLTSLVALSICGNSASAQVVDKAAVDVNAIKFPALHDVVIPEVTKVVLDNGMRLYLAEDHSLPLLEIFARINIGSYLDPKDQIGLSDITADLLREGGTEKWSPDELDELLEGLGASAETSGDIVMSSLSVDTLSSQKELAVELMDQILRHPRFDNARFEQSMQSYKSGISRRNDNPSSVASREFEKMIYGKDSPFAAQVEYSHLNNIKRDDLINFHKKYYKPEHTMVAICGDFDVKEMVKLIKKHFDSWERGTEKVAPIPEVKYDFDQRTGYVEFKDAKQVNIFLGHIGGRSYEEDEPKRIVMNNILGGGFGSRYFNEIRSKAGLCYNVFGSYTSNYTYPGTFINFTSTKSDSAIKATKMIIEEIKKLQKDGVSDEELVRGKEPYLNHFVFNFDKKSKTVNRMLSYELFGLPADFLNKQKEAVEKTTAADVKEMANKYLKPDKMRIMIVGDKKLFDEPIESLNNGQVEEIDITIPEDKK